MDTKLPEGLTQQVLNKFLLANWQRTAYLAYKGYLLHGRGLVVWNWHREELYFTMHGFVAKQEVLTKCFMGKCVQILDNYDPKDCAVVGISWETGDNLYDTFVAQIKIANMPSPISIYSAQHN